MNCKLSSILLVTLLNWGSVTSAAKNIQQFSLQTWLPSVANAALFNLPIAAEEYVPPDCGLPLRREGGGARWRQNSLPT